MRMIRLTVPVTLLCLMMILGCGHRADEVVIGPDGYGKTTLANGITLLVNHDETTSLTAARILVGGGVLSETAENNGISNLMIRMLLKGNDKMTAPEITERLDFLGANVNPTCFRDYTAISISCMTKYFDEVLEIVSQSLLAPTFPDEELVKLKHEVEGLIKASDDDQSSASSTLFWETAYGKQGYGLPTIGTAESVPGITVEDIREHFDRYVRGGNMIVSTATDLDAAQISTIISGRLEAVKAEFEPMAAPGIQLQEENEGFRSFDRNQSFVYTGAILDHLDKTEVACVALLHEVMGGNVGSRLWFLRQDEKLAYSVFTQYTIDKHGAAFRAAIGTDTSKVRLALASLDREWDKMVTEGVTPEELADAKVNMKNNLIYRIDRKSSRANNMAYYEYIDYDYRFILDLIAATDNITLEKINGFVKSNFTEDRRYTSVVGKR